MKSILIDIMNANCILINIAMLALYYTPPLLGIKKFAGDYKDQIFRRTFNIYLNLYP